MVVVHEDLPLFFLTGRSSLNFLLFYFNFFFPFLVLVSHYIYFFYDNTT